MKGDRIMEWNLDDSRPIWPQIKDILTREILAGTYPMGSAFPTVRDLAQDAKVNRNTMQRALSELESEGLVITNRTAGRTVTGDEALIAKIRERIAKENISRFLGEMETLGYTIPDILEMMRLSASETENTKGGPDR